MTNNEILDPRNRNCAECNLTPGQINALKELIKLQRERQITIKACDKGSGIIILNFNEYMRACYEHLFSTLESKGQVPKYYYKEVSQTYFSHAKKEITTVLEEALAMEWITNGEFQVMNPEEMEPARFYCNFKVHKEHKHGETPPVRPIISGSGSTTENLGIFVEHHINKLAKSHKSFIEDTPDFLRQIEAINGRMSLLSNTILVTVDVKGAYQNIPQEDGVNVLYDTLEQRQDKEIPSALIAHLMELILKYNIFEYDKFLFQQLLGTAMGSKPAPSYANIYLAKRIDPEIEQLGQKYGEYGNSCLKLVKRFLDDIFMIYQGT